MPIISTRGAGSARGFGFAGGAGASCFVCATGGTVTTCGDFKIHTFTGPGTFTVNKNIKVPANAVVDYLVVAGGASGGTNTGGGGGAGGFRVSNQLGIPAPTMSPLANPTGIPVSKTSFPVTVGGGGAQVCGGCGPFPESANAGNNSIFSTITSTGGGAAANGVGGNPNPGGTALTGGSGGGAAFPFPPNPKLGAAGNTPPTSPPQGNNGGDGARNPPCNWGGGGGGGGASAVGGSFPYTGQPGPNSRPGSPGGEGSFISPSFAVNSAGTTGPTPGVRYFAGGGGSVTITQFGTAAPGVAGGGGAGGSNVSPGGGSAGTENTGGGGGAGTGPAKGYAGGSGIVLIRYKFQ
jgi:hypothetical protein